MSYICIIIFIIFILFILVYNIEYNEFYETYIHTCILYDDSLCLLYSRKYLDSHENPAPY